MRALLQSCERARSPEVAGYVKWCWSGGVGADQILRRGEPERGGDVITPDRLGGFLPDRPDTPARDDGGGGEQRRVRLVGYQDRLLGGRADRRDLETKVVRHIIGQRTIRH